MEIFRRKVPWTKCVPQIIPAKQRLLTFFKELCASQETANEKVRRAVVLRYSANSRRLANADDSLDQLPSLSISINFSRVDDAIILTSKTTQRGIIYTGVRTHFHDIFQSIYSVRMMKVSLPVEIWVNDRDHKLCQKIFNRVSFPEIVSNTTSRRHRRRSLSDTYDGGENSVACKKLPNFVKGFTSKFYALLYTKFTDVLFIDADNIVVGDVNTIFDSPGYLKTGSVLWPDLWGDKCRAWKAGTQAGDSSYQTHVLFMAHFAGLQWVNEREYAQEAETGQMAFDLTRHAGLIDLGRKIIEDEEFLKKVINGDKDIFRFAHIMTGVPFHFVTHFPGYSFSGHERDCLVHFFDPLPSHPSSNSLIGEAAPPPNPDSNSTSTPTSSPTSAPTSTLTESKKPEVPMFFHQLKSRNPNSFRQILRIPTEYRDSASACIVLGPLPDDTYGQRNNSRGRMRRLGHHGHDDMTHRQCRMAASMPSSNETNNSDVIPALIVDMDLESTADWRFNFAQKLFSDVDAEWRRCGCGALITPTPFQYFSSTFS